MASDLDDKEAKKSRMQQFLLAQEGAEDASLNRSLSVAAQRNPDEYAKVVDISTKTGIPFNIVEREQPRLESLLKEEEMKGQLADSPTTRKKMLDPAFAAQAQDDVSGLSQMERQIRNSDASYWENLKLSWAAGEATTKGYQIGMERYEGIAQQLLTGVPYTTPPETLKQLEATNRNASHDTDYSFIPSIPMSAAKQGALYWEIAKSSAEGAFEIGAPVAMANAGLALWYGQLGPQLFTPEEMYTVPAAFTAGLVVGGGAGAKYGGIKEMFRAEAGGALNEFLTPDEQGRVMDNETAFYAATAAGAINAGWEYASLRLLGGTFTGAKQVIRARIRKELMSEGGKELIMKLAGRYTASVMGEGAEEILQKYTTAIAGEIGKLSDDGDFANYTPEEVADKIFSKELLFEALEEGGEAVKASILLSGPGTVISATAQISEFKRAKSVTENEQTKLTGLIDIATESTLRKRSPSEFKALIRQIEEESGEMADVYISVEEAYAWIEAEGIDVNNPPNTAVAQIVAQLTAKMNVEEADSALVAQETGVDIAVSAADFMTYMPDSKSFESLRAHIKMSQNSFTQAEVADAERNYKARIKELMASADEHTGLHKEAKEIYEQIRSEIVATGTVTDKEAELQARIIPAIITTMAAQAGPGISISDIYGMLPLSVFGPNVKAPAGTTVNQVVSMDERRLTKLQEEIAGNQAELAEIQAELDADDMVMGAIYGEKGLDLTDDAALDARLEEMRFTNGLNPNQDFEYSPDTKSSLRDTGAKVDTGARREQIRNKAKRNEALRAAQVEKQGQLIEKGAQETELMGQIAANASRGELNQSMHHGSPYLFDAFDMDKIGTGEGAQAFGWGLYFAEQSGVAQGYIVRKPTLEHMDEADADAIRAALKKVGNLGFDTRGEAIAAIKEYDDWAERWDVNDEAGKELVALVEKTGLRDIDNSGHIYEVDISDEAVAKMLDWDAEVGRDLIDLLYEIDENVASRLNFPQEGVTGGVFYVALKKALAEKKLKGTGEYSDFQAARNASEYLLGLGIPGIKYLDGMSRNTAGGTLKGVVEKDGKYRSQIEFKANTRLQGSPQTIQTSMAFDSKEEAVAWAEEQIKSGTSNVVTFSTAPITIKSVDGEAISKADSADLLYQSMHHGSAALFDEFDMSKIGTGEGSQMQGWGLYFADRFGVGKGYAKRHALEKVGIDELEAIGVAALKAVGDKAHESDMTDFIDGLYTATTRQQDEIIEGYPADQREGLRAGLAAMRAAIPEGHVYEVEIDDAAIANMLLWDKPLSSQPESVQAALKKVDIGRLAGLAADVRQNIYGDKQWFLVDFYGEWGTQAFSTEEEARASVVAEAEQAGLSGDITGGEFYKKLAGAEDGGQALSEHLLSLGIPGTKYYDGASRNKRGWFVSSPMMKRPNVWTVYERSPGMGSYEFGSEKEATDWVEARNEEVEASRTHNVVTFSTAPITIKSVDGKAVSKAESDTVLEQSGKRGAIKLQTEDGQGSLLRMMQAHDKSTFLHEFSHWGLDLYRTMAQDPRADETFKRDAAQIAEWLGAENLDNLTDAQHEKFAEHFEKYLMEGKAPSLSLKRAFQQFAEWLKEIYQTRGQKLFVDKATRDMFDHFLASDAEIEAVEAELAFDGIFKSAEEAGMTDEQYTQYIKEQSYSTNEAKDKLRVKILQRLTRMATAHWKSESKIRQARIANELQNGTEGVNGAPGSLGEAIYRLRSFLTDNNNRMDRQVVYHILGVDSRLTDSNDPNVVDPEVDTLSEAIAKLGGIDRTEAALQGIDPAVWANKAENLVVHQKPLFRAKGGRSFDDIAQSLAEDGYLPSQNPNDLLMLLDKELYGKTQYSVRADMNKIYGEDGTKIKAPTYLRSKTKIGGVHPAEIAGAFGYADVFDMFEALEKEPTLAVKSKALAEAEMLAEYGDILNDGSLEGEALLAAHNEQRGKLILKELNQIARMANKAVVAREILKANARKVISLIKRSELKPEVFIKAEVKAAGEAAQALQKGDLEAAYAAKARQAEAHYQWREAFLAKQRMDATEKRAKALVKKKWSERRVNTETIGQLVKLANAALTKARHDAGALGAVKDAMTVVGNWIAMQNAAGESALAIMGASLAEDGKTTDMIDVLENGVPMHSMTVGEMDNLRAVMDSMYHAAVKDSARERAIYDRYIQNEVLAESKKIKGEDKSIPAGSFVGDNQSKPPGKGLSFLDRLVPVEKLKEWKESFSVYHLKLWLLAKEMDGMEEMGPVYKAVVTRLKHAAMAKMVMHDEVYRELESIFKGNGKIFHRWHNPGRTKVSMKLDSGVSRRFSTSERIMLVLNWGNPENREAVEKQWRTPLSKDDVMRIADTLSGEELDMVERVWKLLDSHRSEIAELEKSRTGVAPKFVEAEPFELSNGRVMAGGYMPLMANAKLSYFGVSDPIENRAKAQSTGAFTQAYTVHNYTKTRKGFGGNELDLDILGIFRHLDEVVHDLTHRQAVADVDRIFKNQHFKKEAIRRMGDKKYKALNSRLLTIAGGAVHTTELHGIERLFRHARLGVTINALAFSAATGITQSYGAANSIAELGPLVFAEGMAEFMLNPVDNYKFIRSRSIMMRDRVKYMARDPAAIHRELKGVTLNEQMIAWGFKPLLAADYAVSLPTWWAAYKVGLNHVANPENTNFTSEQDAVDFADDTVFHTQQSGLDMDLSGVEAGGEFLKTAVMMYSAFNAIHNTLKASKMKAQMSKASYARHLFNLAVVIGVIAMFEVWRSDDDWDEEKDNWLWNPYTRSALSLQLSRYIAGRDAATYLQYGIEGATPLVQMMATPIEANKQIGQSIKSGELDAGLISALNNVLVLYTHNPVFARSAAKVEKYLLLMYQGKVDDPSLVDAIMHGKPTKADEDDNAAAGGF